MMKISLLLFISFLFCLQAKAQTLSLVDDTDKPRAFFSNTVSAQAVTAAPSGDGTSSDAPTLIYLPVHSATNENYSVLSDAANQLLKYTTSWNGSIGIELNANNNTGTDYYLYAAVQESGTTYKLIKNLGDLISANSNVDYTYWFTMSDFCNVANCANGTITTLERMVFFFLSSTQPASSFTLDSSKTGLYYKLKFSSVVNSQVMRLTEAKRGDERLNLVYSSAPILTDFYKTMVFGYTDTSAVKAAGLYGAIKGLGSLIYDSESSSMPTSGYFTLRNLENGQPVNVAMAFVDKYQFGTSFSSSLIGTPEQIDVFLEKQGCYLLSAGFQDKHFVLDYFKNFRDHVLLKSSLGRNFVSFYYATAPRYTHYIYNSPVLSALVRSGAYVLYFVFNFFPYILLGGIFLALVPLAFFLRRTYFEGSEG